MCNHIHSALQRQRNTQCTSKTIACSKRQNTKHDILISKVIDNRTYGSISTTHDHQAACTADGLFHNCVKTVRMTHRIASGNIYPSFCQFAQDSQKSPLPPSPLSSHY